MKLIAICAIIAAAFLHAVWNFLLKDSHDKAICILIIYMTSLPFALGSMFFAGLPSLEALPIICLSAALQTGYCIMLFKGYELGSLSSVYPIARGSAPVFIFICSLLFFQKSYNLQIILGVIIICTGLVSYGLLAIQKAGSRPGEIFFALGVGLFIAGYSITDATATRLVGNVFSFFGLMAIFNRLLLLTYFYLFEKQVIPRVKKEFDHKFVLGGLFSFICYAIVLWAYKVIPIPVVATLRESSVVFATLFGIFLLGENLSIAKAFMVITVVIGLFLIMSG